MDDTFLLHKLNCRIMLQCKRDRGGGEYTIISKKHLRTRSVENFQTLAIKIILMALPNFEIFSSIDRGESLLKTRMDDVLELERDILF